MGWNRCYKLIVLFVLLVVSTSASAQLVGSFRITDFVGDSITQGCEPLVVTFVDSSKINGVPVPYVSTGTGGTYNSHFWQFGNPPFLNTSFQQRPSFVYPNAGTYTITLTVSADGITFQTVTKTLTVQPQPIVGFYCTPLNGCSPLTVTCYDTSANSTNCTWSLGDGTVIANQCTITHTYSQSAGIIANCFPVTLIATNQFGCQATLTKSNYVCISPKPRALFTADNVLVCDSPFTVNFTDTSVSTNGLSYFWRFDHPNTNPFSTAQNPTHTFPAGTRSYTVSLVVRDLVCNTADTIIKTAYISTSNVNVDFSIDTNEVCQGNSVSFTSRITGAYNNVLWEFGPNGSLGTSTQVNPVQTFNIPGTFDVRLRVFAANGCEHDTTYTALITVRPRPVAAFAYSPNPANSCQAPFEVDFVNQSTGAVSYSWLFQHPSPIFNTNQQSPSYIYQDPGTYSVSLQAVNQFGCQSQLVRPNIIQIQPTVVGFTIDNPGGCAPSVVTFTDVSTSPAINPIIGWSWDFDDPGSGLANTSTLRNPVHTYNGVGIYDACLTIVTQSGCVGTICQPVSVGNAPNASFTIAPLTVCTGEPFVITNTSTGVVTDYTWIFGAPNGPSSILQNPPPYVFDEPGTYTIELTVGENGCEDDTSIVVTVLPPQADFDVSVNCAAPGTLRFTDLSQGADIYDWDFGDGNSSSLANPLHTYAISDTYTVVLTVTNLATGCTHEYEEDVEVSVLNAAFTTNRVGGCTPTNINFTNQSTGAGITYAWNFGDPASGPSNVSASRNDVHNYFTPGIFSPRLIITDLYGCRDTFTATNLIRISGVEARFTSSTRLACIPSNNSSFPTVSFTSQSVAFTGSSIVSHVWNFDDPLSGANNTSTLTNPTHRFDRPGQYDITLTVTNNDGCTSTVTLVDQISIRRPLADFTSAFNLFCVGQPVQFTNLSTGLISGTSYTWDFGDAGNADTSRLENPSYAYSDTGSYTVRLIVREGPLGCTDTVTKINSVRIDVPDLRFTANDTFRYCPPHLVNFTNFANLDTLQVRNVRWDFGDGQGFSNLLQPSYIYDQAGMFTVCLWVEFVNGCADSICYPNYINIGGAVGNITALPDTGCSPLEVCFNANTDSSAARLIWFFGDNNPWVSGTDSICHTYTEAGLYQPAVLLIDTQVPACQYVLTYDDTIVVDSVIAGFYFDSDTICESEPLQFTDSSKTIAGRAIVAWEWDFDDNSPIDTNQNPIHRFQISGIRNVTLTAYSSLGCVGSITRQIFVRDRPTAAFDVSDTIGCEVLLVSFTDQSIEGDTTIASWYWNFGVVDSTNDTSIVQNPPDYFYGDTGQYVVSLLVIDENGCRDTILQEVNVYPNPNGLANPDTVSICLNDTIWLMGDTNYVNYNWTPGIWLSDSTVARPLAVPLDTIDYELITTDQFGCFTIDSIHVIVNPLPTLTLSPYPDTAICEGQTVQLTALGSGIGYIWTPATGLDNPNTSSPLATPPQTTTYEVYTVDANGCNITDTVRIVVNRFFTDFVAERVCLGDRTDILDLSSTSDLPLTTWQWNFGDLNATNDTSLVRNPNYTYTDSGSYTVTLVLTDVLGCTDTLQEIARVDHPSEPAAGPDTIICFGDAIQLTASGGDTIYWTPVIDIDDVNSFTPTVSPQVTTVYVANITYGVCPFDTARVVVEVNPTPQLEVDEIVDILKGDSVVLETTTGQYDSIYWEPATWLSCADCPSPLSKPDSTITYTVTVIDSLGCVNTKQILVRVEERCSEDQIFVGNGFTPNGDGVNDIAYARLRGLKGLIMYRVFDRWGDLVFETNNPYEGWEGKNIKGEQLNSGVYVYIVEAECFSGRKLIKTGNVAIIK